MISWVSFADLHRDVTELCARLPDDLIGVVGIPRSGLMVASLIALHRHIMLADSETFLDTSNPHSFLPHGPRLPGPSSFNPNGTIFVIDDSSRSGETILPIAIEAQEQYKHSKILVGCMYPTASVAEKLDVFARVVPTPRLFQWNWLHHRRMRRAFFDMDGVLCEDWTVGREDDHPEEYANHLANAKPLYVPRKPIAGIITNRLKKNQEATEAWLQRHGVQYKSLVMCPAATAHERRRIGKCGEWKGKMMLALDGQLFIESDRRQADRIAAISGKQVLCVSDWKMR